MLVHVWFARLACVTLATADGLADLRHWLLAKDEGTLVPILAATVALAIFGGCVPRRARADSDHRGSP